MTAGMAHGTADWQLDLMRENENARIWEEQNRVDVDYTPVISKLGDALAAMQKAESLMGTAAAMVGGSPKDEQIMSVMDGMENLVIDIGRIIKNMKEEMGK